MANIPRSYCAVLLAAMTAVGCAPVPVSRESWDYSGADAMLRLPFSISSERRQEIAKELGPNQPGKPSDAIQEKIRANFETWKKRRSDAVQAAKDNCARTPGESAASGYWSGYSEVFLGCMRTLGWTRSRYGDPL